MKIVGMYVADAYLSKAEFDNASKTLADKIANLTSTHMTCAFIVFFSLLSLLTITL